MHVFFEHASHARGASDQEQGRVLAGAGERPIWPGMQCIWVCGYVRTCGYVAYVYAYGCVCVPMHVYVLAHVSMHVHVHIYKQVGACGLQVKGL